MIKFSCPNCTGEHAKTREEIDAARDDGAVACWCGFQFHVLFDGSTFATRQDAEAGYTLLAVREFEAKARDEAEAKRRADEAEEKRRADAVVLDPAPAEADPVPAPQADTPAAPKSRFFRRQ